MSTKSSNMTAISTQYFTNRQLWRAWLQANFETEDDVWLEYPKKKTGKKRIVYNDAVEEALCFGWIDSTVKSLNETTTIQRFCKRRKKSTFSQPNKERLKWLYQNDRLHPSIKAQVRDLVAQEFVFPEDILQQLAADPAVWKHYQTFSAPYQRIRVAYIDQARKRPE